jgi:tetratricopeptide (TPR) repeat protein
MVFRRLTVALAICAGCLTACQSSQSSSSPRVTPTGPRTGEDTAPPSHYRAELLRQAMRGLRYDSGLVEIDEPVAAAVAERGTLEQAMAEYERGQELLRQNRRIQAIEAHTRAVLIAPEAAVLYEGLGTALLAKQKGPEAIAAYRTALDLAPQSVSARFNLAQALQRAGQFEGAVDALHEVLGLEPDHADAHSRVAILLYYLQRDAEAWVHVHRVESLGATVLPQFRELLARRTPEPVD